MDKMTTLMCTFHLTGMLITSLVSVTASSLPPPCDNEVYCSGKLLHTIQMASVFPDSKTFVDMKMRQDSSKTLAIFRKMMKKTLDKPTKEDLETFLKANFEPPGSEFEEWKPTDWQPSPKFLQKIDDRKLRDWATDLHYIWKLLGRKMKSDVLTNSHLYSIIPVPHPVIVPGGRFREFYYWDSYWIVRGLLLSEMNDTVRGMLSNFISIVERYGFIPNGGRQYYLMRSQPPLLIPMFDSYFEFTKDISFIKQNIKVLEKEFDFWMKNRTVKVVQNNKEYTLCRYRDESSGPRPESYREDVISGQFMKEDEKDAFYSQLKSAAESGWDFSTRWFMVPPGVDRGNLTHIHIKSIIPVDLNAIIYWNARILSKFYTELNNVKKAEYYDKVADEWMDAVTAVLWRPEVGIWLDYDIINNVKRDHFYPSNLAPLWTNCYDSEKKDYFTENAMKYINKTGIMSFLAGIPTSKQHSGEQWDYPNAWPPLQHIMIMGLDNTENVLAQQAAFELAEKWVYSNYVAYTEKGNGTKAMYEKYDATVVGGHGGGGEYEVQLGFGWTNGVIMDLLNKYGDRIHIKEDFSGIMTNSALTAFNNNHLGQMFTLLLAMGVTITAGCIGVIVYTKRHCPHRPNKSHYIKIPGAPNL